MYPILYAENETQFASLGVGELSDCISCKVTEELNGIFELELHYPESGNYYNEIQNNMWIMAKANETMQPQLFRVYKVEADASGEISVYGEHASYLLNGIPVRPFTATGASNAMQAIKDNSLIANRFTFDTDIQNTSSAMEIKIPQTARACLGGVSGSFLDVFSGSAGVKYTFDNFNVHASLHRGQDNGAKIEYGINLVDLKQEQSIEDTYTGVVAYWTKEEDNVTTTVTGDVVLGATKPNNKIALIDASSNFEEKPAKESLNTWATDYMLKNNITVPKVNLTVSFVPLWQTDQYKDVAGVEHVALGDTVTVEFPRLNVSAKAEVIKTEYDTLLERYESIELGDVKSTLADTLDKTITQSIDNAFNKTSEAIKSSVEHATQLITGGLGGYVVFNADENGKPNEILIMDTDDKTTAKEVWRWNRNGLGHSHSGYNGPFDDVALTMDGQINANLITAGTLRGVELAIGDNFRVSKNGTLTASNINVSGTISGRLSGGGLDCSAGSLNATQIKDRNGNVMIDTKSDGIAIYAYYNGQTALVFKSGVMNGNTPVALLSNTTTTGIPVVSNGSNHAFTLDWDGDELIVKVEGTEQVRIGAGTYAGGEQITLHRLYNPKTGDHMVSRSTSEGEYVYDGVSWKASKA